MTVLFPVSCLSNCANSQGLIEGSLTQLLFVHQLTFGLRGTERIELKSIEHDYIRIFKVSVFQAMGIRAVGYAWDWKYYTHRVEGSSPLKGYFLSNLLCFNTILASVPE